MVELLAAGATGESFSVEAGETDLDDGGPARGSEFMLAISPEHVAGSGWAEHCEEFFQRYDAIQEREDHCPVPAQFRRNSAPQI
jgi:delta1-piperideine-2-carboxylate reductase